MVKIVFLGQSGVVVSGIGGIVVIASESADPPALAMLIARPFWNINQKTRTIATAQRFI